MRSIPSMVCSFSGASSNQSMFRLRPAKVHIFSKDTEERIYFGDQKPLAAEAAE